MATVNKDFKIKSGLIVEGTTATVNGYDILTKKPADDQYIIDLIGGETLVKSVSNEFDVSAGGELSLDRTVVDAYYDAAGSAATAEQNAKDYADDLAPNYDAAGSAANVAADLSTHENDTTAHGATGAVVGTTNTQTLTNKTIGDTLNFTGAGAMTINSDSHIVLTPAAGSSVKWGADILATQGYADQAEADAKSYADSLASNYDAAGAAAAAQTAAEGFATQAIADLVDSAPSTLDTLNELAQALQDNPDIIGDLQDIAAGKQDTLTEGANILIQAGIISVTGLDSEDISDFNSAALSATSTAYDLAGSASSAQEAAENYADGLSVNYDVAGAASTAQEAAEDYADNAINALDTDDIEEGATNKYFTDALAKTSAADLLTGASLTNITITGTGAGLTITAENGVADSDTNDLAEGTDNTGPGGVNNLYFTDARALTAIEDANIQPSSIDITWVRREEATWTDVNTASKVTCHSAGTSEGSMKYLVRVTAQVGGVRHSHVTEVLATVAGNNGVAVVEYGTIYTSENPLATVTVEWNAGTSAYDLNVTTANNNSEVMVAATLISALD